MSQISTGPDKTLDVARMSNNKQQQRSWDMLTNCVPYICIPRYIVSLLMIFCDWFWQAVSQIVTLDFVYYVSEQYYTNLIYPTKCFQNMLKSFVLKGKCEKLHIDAMHLSKFIASTNILLLLKSTIFFGLTVINKVLFEFVECVKTMLVIVLK